MLPLLGAVDPEVGVGGAPTADGGGVAIAWGSNVTVNDSLFRYNFAASDGGGLFSNTPLGPAINALEQAAGGDRSVERELVVVDLFPMRAALPHTFTDVLQRMMQLQYTSRLTLDKPIYGAEEYASLREFYRLALAKQAEAVVLKKQ